MTQQIRNLSLYIAVCVLFQVCGILSCSRKKTTDPYVPGATVWGTVALPEIADGKPYAVVLDSDTILTNDFIMSHESVCRLETSVPYSFYDTPAGEYYLYGIVWTTGEKGKALRSGDFFGYYGSTNGPPDSANVVVPYSGEVIFDLILKVI